MLKRLFTSNTRIKLLTTFLMNGETEFFIRELTRKLDEQINSVRRELDNLKKMGFLKTKSKNGKKYYFINQSFIFLPELRGIIQKSVAESQNISKEMEKLGDVKVLVISGVLTGRDTTGVDMLIVGTFDREKLANYINNEISAPRPIKYSVLTVEDYQYRLNCHDKFVHDILSDPENKILINKLD